VQLAVLPQIFNLRPGLNRGQHDTRRRIGAVLQGNARPETHAADASHLAEAAETGWGFFIARDSRKIASPHSITSSAPAGSVDGRARPSALAALRLTMGSNLVG
jgi:hypothetical protein